jgi:hypothetical protein
LLSLGRSEAMIRTALLFFSPKLRRAPNDVFF